ncbi:PREDICTED: 1-acyl-sn-glycerol-3-phosphate acyltransferase epsilon [Haliaeetus leucocephalus]|nr:PREDICTED: 1-acyl-sn-glycerol-3-phosphate acyltransferase epsilon [Haliaeetus leucocephalus]
MEFSLQSSGPPRWFEETIATVLQPSIIPQAYFAELFRLQFLTHIKEQLARGEQQQRARLVPVKAWQRKQIVEAVGAPGCCCHRLVGGQREEDAGQAAAGFCEYLGERKRKLVSVKRLPTLPIAAVVAGKIEKSGKRKGCDSGRALPALEWQPASAARTLWPVLHVCSIKLAADKNAVGSDNCTGYTYELAVILYGDLPKNKENVIYLSNHQCTVDWIIADMLAIRQNALGHVRYVLKDGLKWLPLYGWYFSQHGGVYVKRSAKFNEKEMREKLRAQMKAETPMYLVIFPEGTRYNPEIPKVIADSQSFAEKEGLAILKHVLTPRVKATHVAIDTMKDYLDAVYDVTVAYEGTVDHKGQRKLAPSMTEFLCKECPRVHIFIDRIELKDIPEEQMYMRRWLHERFEIKDKLLIEFYDAKDSKRRNKFPGKSVHSKLSLKKTLPSLLFLGGLTASMLLTESGRKLYVKTWIYGTLIGCLWVSIKP